MRIVRPHLSAGILVTLLELGKNTSLLFPDSTRIRSTFKDLSDGTSARAADSVQTSFVRNI